MNNRTQALCRLVLCISTAFCCFNLVVAAQSSIPCSELDQTHAYNWIKKGRILVYDILKLPSARGTIASYVTVKNTISLCGDIDALNRVFSEESIEGDRQFIAEKIPDFILLSFAQGWFRLIDANYLASYRAGPHPDDKLLCFMDQILASSGSSIKGDQWERTFFVVLNSGAVNRVVVTGKLNPLRIAKVSSEVMSSAGVFHFPVEIE